MTDPEIRNAVLAALRADPQVGPNAVGVAVHEGVVTLMGQVPSFAAKTAAEQAALRTPGVRAIAQEIDVRQDDESFCTDEVIATRIARYLGWNASVSNDAAQARVDRGWVTLRGKVDWAFQRAHLERFVTKLNGVTGISNLIQLRHATVASRLSGLFRRSLQVRGARKAEGRDIQ